MNFILQNRVDFLELMGKFRGFEPLRQMMHNMVSCKTLNQLFGQEIEHDNQSF